jgi:phosphonopyruvate decarboxylase
MPSARSFVHIDPESPMQETIRDFLPPDVFYNQLLERGMEFFTGVPDSLLADFCGYIADNAPPEKHIITANEGLAVSVAAGYHMATRKFPVVYL